MVQAILDGRKTMTRRVKGLETFNSESSWIFEKIVNYEDPKFGCQAYFRADDTNHLYGSTCPYGQVGDLLWVKETYYAYGHWTTITKNGKSKKKFYDLTRDNNYLHQFHADWQPKQPAKLGQLGWHKRPCLFMPKEACRLKLYIKSIRVERLTDITEEDAIAEGVEKIGFMYFDYYKNSELSKLARKKDAIPLYKSPLTSFQSLWASINGINAWDENPWVWVIDFERIECFKSNQMR